MHLAIVIASVYERNAQVHDLLASSANEALVGERFSRGDAGYHVEYLAADRDLPERLEGYLASLPERPESVIIYVSAYIAMKSGRAPALLLDGDRLRAFPLTRFFGLISPVSSRSAIIVDAAAMTELAHEAFDIAPAIDEAAIYAGNTSVLYTVRPMSRAVTYAPSRLTDLFLLCFDYVLSSYGDPARVTLGTVFETMRAEPASFASVGACGCRYATEDFLLLPGVFSAQPSGVWNRPSQVPNATTVPPPAGDTPLPSFDDAFDSDPAHAPHARSSSIPPPSPRAPSPPVTRAEPPPARTPATGSSPSEPPVLGSAPEPSRSSAPPPIPTVESHVAEAKKLVRQGDGDGALEAFDRALLLADPDDEKLRARLLVDIAAALKTLDRSDEALEKLTEAIDLDPKSSGAYDAAARILLDEADHRGVEQLRRRRLEVAETDDERVQVLETIISLWLDEADDLERAAAVLEELLELRSDDVLGLQRLIELRDRREDHQAAIEARRRLSEVLADEPVRRAQLLADASRIAADRLGDTDQSVLLAKEALDHDPTALGALELAAKELVANERWDDLAELYETVLARLEPGLIAAQLASRLAELYRRRVKDDVRAIDAFKRVLEVAPNDVEAHVALSELHEKCDDLVGAIRFRRGALRLRPTDADGFERLRSLFASHRDADAEWNAASALVVLERATPDVEALADAHRVESLLQASRGLTQEEWSGGLLYPEREAGIGEVLGVVSETAISLRIKALRKSKKLPTLMPEYEHDPAKSTTTLARSLAWTSRLLGIDSPKLYIYPEVPRDMVSFQSAEPTTLVSKSLASGLSLPELSFLWGRQLSFFRPEHHLIVFFPTATDLASLLLATLALKSDDRIKRLEGDTKWLAKALRKSLDVAEHTQLREVVARFRTQDASSRMLAWARSIELAAGRAGLLACGDVRIATSLVERHPFVGLASKEEQTADLLAFSVSEEYQELRRRLEVGVLEPERATG